MHGGECDCQLAADPSLLLYRCRRRHHSHRTSASRTESSLSAQGARLRAPTQASTAQLAGLSRATCGGARSYTIFVIVGCSRRGACNLCKLFACKRKPFLVYAEWRQCFCGLTNREPS